MVSLLAQHSNSPLSTSLTFIREMQVNFFFSQQISESFPEKLQIYHVIGGKTVIRRKTKAV